VRPFLKIFFRIIPWILIIIFLAIGIGFKYKGIWKTFELSEDIKFPEDEGAHQWTDSEWWYFKTHLSDKLNPENIFGATMVFFKPGLLYLIVADIKNQKKYSAVSRKPFEILSSDKLSLKIGNNYWTETDLFKYKINYEDEDIGLNFILEAIKKPMIVSDDPKSLIGIYLIQPRINVSGDLSLEGKKYEVDGLGWIDHQISPGLNSESILEWKWWAVQLNNDIDLTFSDILFAKEGEAGFEQYPLVVFNKNSSGFNFEKVPREKYTLEELNYWENPLSGIRYPISWLLEIPAKNITLEINSVLKDQVINGISVYEGACRVNGIYGNVKVGGWAQFENVFHAKN